jgi:hypothetical protein
MHVPDGTMQSRRVTRDSMGVRCTFLNIMRMFGRIQYFSTWGWAVGCPAGFAALAPRFRRLLGTTDTHPRRERRAGLRRRDRGLQSLGGEKSRSRGGRQSHSHGHGRAARALAPGAPIFAVLSSPALYAIHDVMINVTGYLPTGAVHAHISYFS